MSIFADAQVVVLLADHLGVDTGGKVNALGAGFGLCLMQPTGLTAAMSVIVMVDVPAKYAGQQFALSLELRNEDTDSAVMIATPPSGQLQALRVQQAVPLQAVQIPGLYLPPGVVPIRVQLPVSDEEPRADT